MNPSKKTIVMFVAVVLLTSVCVMAQGGPGSRGFGRGMAGRIGQPIPPRMGQAGMLGLGLRGVHRLDLTQEQMDTLATIQAEQQQSMQTLREAVQTARNALQEAVMADAGEAELRAAAAAIGQALGDEAVARAVMVQSVKAVLTEEQLAELATLQEQAPLGLGRGGQAGLMRGGRGVRGGRGGRGMGGGMGMGPGRGLNPECPQENCLQKDCPLQDPQ